MSQAVAPFSISRVFNAPRDLVYAVHTEPAHMEKWMGPEGFHTIHAALDLRVGGSYHYGIEGPNGMQMWGKQVFRDIVPNEQLTYIQSFSDKDGGLTRHPMSPSWPPEMLATVTFEAIDATHTKVTITWQPWNADDTGNATFDAARGSMTQGFAGMFGKLDAYLQTL